MALEITHLDKEKNAEVDQLAVERFNEHIVEHFDIEKTQVRANLTIDHGSKENNVTLHFHHKKKHTHLHAKGDNLFKSIAHVIEELERQIKNDNMKQRKNLFRRNNGKRAIPL